MIECQVVGVVKFEMMKYSMSNGFGAIVCRYIVNLFYYNLLFTLKLERVFEKILDAVLIVLYAFKLLCIAVALPSYQVI